MRSLTILFLLLGASAGGCRSTPAPQPNSDDGMVAEVLDGQTIRLADGRTVQYCGVEAPMPGQPFASESTECNRQLVLGKSVRFIADGSGPGDPPVLLAHVYVSSDYYGEGQFIYMNAEQILRGLARFKAPPTSKRTDLVENLRYLEARARERGIGLWALEPQGK